MQTTEIQIIELPCGKFQVRTDGCTNHGNFSADKAKSVARRISQNVRGFSLTQWVDRFGHLCRPVA